MTHARCTRRLTLLFASLAAFSFASGCTSRDNDVSYNMYIRNQGNMPLLRAMEEYGPGQCDFWLNDLDARIENAVY